MRTVMANATLAHSLIPNVASAVGSQLLAVVIDILRSSFVPAVFTLCSIYHLLAPLYTTPKQLSWILTTVVSATMTLVSIPFVWDYASSGGDVKSVRTLATLTYTTSRVFQAYLFSYVFCSLPLNASYTLFHSDLLMGVMYYRSQLGLLTGWIHHIIYVFIVQIAIERAWTHIFCLCALMEVRIHSYTLPIPRLTHFFSCQHSFWLSPPYTLAYVPISHLPSPFSSPVSFSTSSGVFHTLFPPTVRTQPVVPFYPLLCSLAYFRCTLSGFADA